MRAAVIGWAARVAATGALLLAAPAAEAEFFIYGAGTHACAQLVGSADDEGQRAAYLEWMAGFVTGVGSTRVPLAESGREAMWEWVLGYCRDHPGTDVAAATGRMVEALHGRTKQQ